MEQSKTSVKSLYTRKKSNEGTLLEVPGGWLRVRGVDADAVQEAMLAFTRAQADVKEGDPGYGKRPFDDPSVVCTMVSDWSFEEPCTPSAVAEALAEAPWLKTNVVNLAFERPRFLSQSVTPSSDTPKPNSD